jgi:hypothetical protein
MRPEPCRLERPFDDDFKFAVRSRRRVAAAIRQNTRPRVTAMTGGVCPLIVMVAAGMAAAGAAGGTAILGAFFSRTSSRSLRLLFGGGLTGAAAAGLSGAVLSGIASGSGLRPLSTGGTSSTGRGRLINSMSYSFCRIVGSPTN